MILRSPNRPVGSTVPARPGESTGHRPPLANRARLAGPRKFREEFLFPNHWAAALAARLAVEVLAPLADGKPAGHLVLAGLWHPGGDMRGGRGGKVRGFLEQRHALRIFETNAGKRFFWYLNVGIRHRRSLRHHGL